MQGTFIQRFHHPFPSQAFPLLPGLGGRGEEGDGQDRREQAGAAPSYCRTSLTPRRPVSELQSPHSGLRPPNPTSIWSAEPGPSRACFLQKSSGYHRACLTALGLRQTRGTAQRSGPRRRCFCDVLSLGISNQSCHSVLTHRILLSKVHRD